MVGAREGGRDREVEKEREDEEGGIKKIHLHMINHIPPLVSSLYLPPSLTHTRTHTHTLTHTSLLIQTTFHPPPSPTLSPLLLSRTLPCSRYCSSELTASRSESLRSGSVVLERVMPTLRFCDLKQFPITAGVSWRLQGAALQRTYTVRGTSSLSVPITDYFRLDLCVLQAYVPREL